MSVGLYCDIDEDGDTDILDALAVAQISVGLKEVDPSIQIQYENSCDLTGDGRVDINDVLRIAQCNVGLPVAGCRP